VLTTRLAHLLVTGKARSPGEILAVTFTNKAAREMKDRVAALLNRPSVEGWWLGTFHAVAVRILRRHAEVVGLKSNFTILDTDDQIRLVKQILQAENVDEKKWPARAMLAIIERWKDRGLTPERVSAGDAGDFARGRAVELYKAYQERLKTLNACDFGDLLLHNLTGDARNAITPMSSMPLPAARRSRKSSPSFCSLGAVPCTPPTSSIRNCSVTSTRLR
jgi:DNA helicase-2/ATP-dependent DNA helicase PcrA